MANSIEWFSQKSYCIVFYQLDSVQSNKSKLCDQWYFQITLTILGEQILVFSDEELGLRTIEVGVVWAIFQDSGNSLTYSTQLLKKLESHSEIMQLAIFSNWRDVIGRIVRFYFKVFNEKLDFICISRSKKQWILWIDTFTKMSASDREWLYLCR